MHIERVLSIHKRMSCLYREWHNKPDTLLFPITHQGRHSWCVVHILIYWHGDSLLVSMISTICELNVSARLEIINSYPCSYNTRVWIKIISTLLLPLREWSYLVCSTFLNLNCVQNVIILQESSFQSEAVRIYLQRQGYIIMSSIFQWTNIRRQKYGCRQKRRILLEYGCKKNPHPFSYFSRNNRSATRWILLRAWCNNNAFEMDNK